MAAKQCDRTFDALEPVELHFGPRLRRVSDPTQAIWIEEPEPYEPRRLLGATTCVLGIDDSTRAARKRVHALARTRQPLAICGGIDLEHLGAFLTREAENLAENEC